MPLMPVRVPLPPIEKPAELIVASSEIARALSEGEISMRDASAISGVVANVGKTVEINELAQRIAALEAAAQAREAKQ